MNAVLNTLFLAQTGQAMDSDGAMSALNGLWMFLYLLLQALCLYFAVPKAVEAGKKLDDEQGKGMFALIGFVFIAIAPTIALIVTKFMGGASTPFDAALGL